MVQKYELLKDIDSPSLTASKGTIGEVERTRVWFDDRRFFFELHHVAYATDWFRPIPNPQPKEQVQDSFVWEDADWVGIAKEMGVTQGINDAAEWLMEQMNIILRDKASKHIPKEELRFAQTTVKSYDGERINRFDFDEVGQYKIPQPTEHLSKGKDWEILEVDINGLIVSLGNHGLYCGALNGIFYEMNIDTAMSEKGAKIRSVKRLRDGEVFSIGEDTADGKIKSFEIDKGGVAMKVNLEGNEYIWFHTAEKKSTPPQPIDEPIEVICLHKHDNFKGNGNNTFWYQFCTSKPIEHINNSSLKKAIQDILNTKK